MLRRAGQAALSRSPPCPQADRSGARHRLASAELQGSELQDKVHDSWGRNPPYQLDTQGRLVLAEAQVGDERDYVCMVRAGAAGTAEATARLRVFGECPRAPREGWAGGSPGKRLLTVNVSRSKTRGCRGGSQQRDTVCDGSLCPGGTSNQNLIPGGGGGWDVWIPASVGKRGLGTQTPGS